MLIVLIQNKNMTETYSPIPTSETYISPDDPLAAEAVFDGVYHALVYDLEHGSQRHALIDGTVQAIDIDPSYEFVKPHFDDAERSVEPLDQPIPAATFGNKYMNEARLEAENVYRGQPGNIDVRIQRARELTQTFLSRAAQMQRNGTADGLTIKLFLDRIGDIKHFAHGYNKVVAKNDESMPDKAASDRYEEAIPQLLRGHPDLVMQEDSPFVHVNSRGTQPSDRRYYISPRLNGQPEAVVQIWTQTLQDLGLDGEVYYKVALGVARQYDLLLGYASGADSNAKMMQAIKEFGKRCPPELLSDTTLPTGIKIAHGVAIAPEPTELNTLLRYRGKGKASYNQFVCGLSDLALRRASYDFMQQGWQPEQIAKEQLAAAARPYFVQLTALSGIDPTTMEAFSE